MMNEGCAAPRERVHHVGLAVRCFGVTILLGALVLAVSANPGWSTGVALALGSIVLLLTVEVRHPLTLRNYFLVYTVALFTLGASLIDLSTPGLTIDMVLFVVAFLAGYALSSLRMRSETGPASTKDAPRANASPERVRGIEELLLVFIGLNVLLLLWRISQYGVGAFYAGQPLLDLHTTYGQASVSGGLEQIVRFFLKFTALAAVVLYVQTSLLNSIKIRFRYPMLLLVVLPILSLARSDALIGAWLLLAIYGVERRASARSRQARTGDGRAAAAASRPAPRRALVVGLTVLVAVAAGFVIGGIRMSQLAPHMTSSALGRSAPLLKSELTPIQAYSEIKEHEAILGRTHGSTVIQPLVFKLVPRAFLPGKPINSGAYYMSIIRPGEFAANFALPPTLFGDAYLNFGMTGALAACFLLGLVVARLDTAYREADLARLPWFLIVFANFYAVLRDPLSESVAGLLITFGVWLVLRSIATSRREPSPAERRPVKAEGSSEGQRRRFIGVA